MRKSETTCDGPRHIETLGPTFQNSYCDDCTPEARHKILKNQLHSAEETATPGLRLMLSTRQVELALALIFVKANKAPCRLR